MSTTLRDFIAQRETEIRDLQKALKLELRELQVAKAALEGQPTAATSPSGAALTIKDMARQVLDGQPNGLNSSGILDGIKKLFDRDVERTSLSPQLSRLKDDKELVLNGEVWFTADHWTTWSSSWSNQTSVAPANKIGERAVPSGNPFAKDYDDSEVPF